MNEPIDTKWNPLPPPDDAVPTAAKMFFVLSVLMCAGFAAWAVYGTLDIVSQAAGEVKPRSQIKTVQHLEGGIVSKIAVQEGAEVKAGQVLVVLESIQTDADANELKFRLASLEVGIARLKAEAEGAKGPTFSASLSQAHPNLVKQALRLFETRRNRTRAEIRAQKETVNQRRQAIREIQVRLKNARNSLKLLDEQVMLSADLLKRKLATKFKHLELMGRQSEIKSRTEEDREALKGSRAALKEAEARLTQITAVSRADANELLEISRREFKELSQRSRKFADSLDRMTLRAPVDGIVKTIHVATLGGVIKAGETVVEIVPLGDTLIIEAQLPTQDIGYVAVGQDAVVRLNSPDLTRFGAIEGKVTGISPDKLIRDDGLPYYRIRIETEKDRFEKNGQIFRLFPGTQVLASIQTGQRTVLEYLLDPFIGTMSEALRER